MLKYTEKLVELLSVKIESNKAILFVSVTYGQHHFNEEWDLDLATGTRINEKMGFTKKSKYRLSLSSSWDAYKQQYYSHVTKVTGDQSENIFFPCSEEYIEKLDSVKSPDYLNRLESNSEKADNINKQVKRIINVNYKPIIAVSLLIIAIISTFILINNNQENVELANQEEQSSFDSSDLKVSNDVTQLSSYKTKTNNDPIDVPSFVLEDGVTYQLPEGYVALTFDDGPSQYTGSIVDILHEYEVGGTFFLLGENVIKYPDQVNYIDDHDIAIGSHSMHHFVLPRLGIEDQKYEILHANERIEQLTNKQVTLFRPPYGIYNDQILDILADHYLKTVMWNKDTEDWKKRSSDQIYQYIVDTESSGGIYLFHETKKTVAALPMIIEYLQEQGLTIVNLK